MNMAKKLLVIAMAAIMTMAFMPTLAFAGDGRRSDPGADRWSNHNIGKY